MDKIKNNSRYFAALLIVVAVMAVYVVRLVDWQLIKGSSFLEKSHKSTTATIPMDAARGQILDISGNGLAVNRTGYAIVFDKTYLTRDTQNKTIAQLITLMKKRGEKWTDILPIKLNEKGQYEFIAGQEKEAATLKSKYYLNMNPYATADECMSEMVKKYEVTGYSPADTRDIISVRYNMTKTGFSIAVPYTFAPDVSRDTVGIVSENTNLLPGAAAKVTTMRQYPNGALAPQIIGTIGAISQEEYKELENKGYSLNDRLGKSGIEQAFESTLRGKTGEKSVLVSPSGSYTETIAKTPSPGNSLYLTLDSRLQAVVNASLAKNVQETQANGKKLSAQNYKGTSSKHGEDCVAGSVVVLRVKDFSVLAAATYPSYDLTNYLTDSNYYNSLIQNKDRPLINRAFNGIFTPGSVVKPCTALAALQEKAITTSTLIEGNSKYTRFASTGLVLGSIGNYGMIHLNYAIQKSSNSFFYEVGYRLGITPLNLYQKHFGLGVKTGIELSESSGVLAGPSQRAAAGHGSWYDADTVQCAVGQSDNKFTPLQLATYTATLANNGVRLKPHLVDKVTDYSGKKVISQTPTQEVDNVGVSQPYMDYVKQAMRSVATDGTASSVFKDYGIAIAAKTGTAVQDNHSDNVTFIGYAPFDKPEIAVAVVLEYGATSAYSLGVAKDIFDAYFLGKTVDANGNLVMPSAATPAAGSSSGASSAGTAGSNAG